MRKGAGRCIFLRFWFKNGSTRGVGRQWVFPAKGCFIDPRSGLEMRPHVLESGLLKAEKRAVQVAGIDKKAGCHTLRQSFVAHMPVNGVNIRVFRHETGGRMIFTGK